MADHKQEYQSVQYLRCSFTFSSIGATINPATDYTYKVAICPVGSDFDATTAVYGTGTYATADGVHYVLALQGPGQTITIAEDTKYKVYIKCTGTGGVAETPVIMEASGYDIIS